jgi:class 3 adenylate cyclase
MNAARFPCKYQERHGGQVIDMAGDSVLAGFPAQCQPCSALEVQAALRRAISRCLPRRCMLFRVGINVGEIIVQPTARSMAMA